MATTCDQKSYALAEHFLADDDVRDLSAAEQQARTMSLALAIQQAVEDWIESEAVDMQRKRQDTADRDDERRRLRGYDAQDVAEKF